MKKKTVLILIENVKRELDSKILLALKAINSDYRVIIGQKGHIWSIFNKCKPAIVLLKSFGPRNTEAINFLKKNNFYIISNDEELVLAWDLSDKINYRMNNENIKKLDILLTVGEIERDEINRQFPFISNKTKVFGNLRLEILKKEKRKILEKNTNLIKKKYGDFYLFLTQFGRLNPAHKRENIIDIAFRRITEENFDPQSLHVSLLNDQILMQREILLQATKFINEFEKNFPYQKLLISPHPVENMLFWKTYIEKKKFKNVYLNEDRHLSVHALINASSLIISSNSTTLLESFFLEKKIINLLSSKKSSVEINILKNISYVVRSSEELTALLLDYKNITLKNSNIENFDLIKNIKNFESNYDSFDNLINLFDKIDVIKSYKSPFINKKVELQLFFLNILRHLMSLLKYYVNYKKDSFMENLYLAKIGDNFKKNQFLERVKNINEYTKINKIKIKQIVPNVFLLEKL